MHVTLTRYSTLQILKHTHIDTYNSSNFFLRKTKKTDDLEEVNLE